MDVLDRADLPFPHSLPEFQRLFPDDAACAAYLEKARWGDGFACPHCGTAGEPFHFENRPGVLRCRFRYFNSSPEVIRLAVMMYVRYPLSLRQVEDLLFERGIDVCHETVRYWWNRFGPLFAGEIRRRRVGRRNWSNWRWHLDEVCVRINGETHYLWRAVDHEGEVLEVFVAGLRLCTKRRDRRAALKFLKHAMKRYGRPGSIVTDRLRSYRAAMNAIGNAAAQTCGRWLNNRAENVRAPAAADSKAGRGDGAVQRPQDPAEIRFRPRLDPQPLQPPTPSQPPRHFQT